MQRGFTIVEMMISLAIGVFFLASVTTTWYSSSRIWNEEHKKDELRIGIEKAMERVKHDVRLSDGNGILFYPSTASEYTAVSIPAATVNANGFYTLSSGAISWDKTIIYHTYTVGDRTQLRRTLFNSFNSNSSTRQTQLDNVVANGTDASASSTTTMFTADSVALAIVPQVATFDGYASSVSRSDNTNFGSIQLSSGSHTIRFEVTGKNSASSSYGIGIDSISLSPSGGPQEAEAITISATSGATPTTQDMTSYGTEWGGGEHIHFPAIASGSYVTFQTSYDQWLESNFSSMTYSNSDTTSGADPYLTIASREDQSLTPGWLAASQVDNGGSADEATASAMSVRSRVLPGFIQRSGVMIRLKFMAGSGGALTINSAYFGPAAGSGSSSMTGLTQLYFDNAAVAVGSTDPAGSTASPGVATSIVIPAGHHVWTNWFPYSVATGGATEYLVSMSLPNTGESATTWYENPPSTTQSYRTASAADASSADWSSLTVTPSTSLFAVSEISSWQNTATATSQVYDTKLTAPNYDQLQWTATTAGGSTVSLKIRTSSAADMSTASDWSLLSGHAASPASLASLANLRYVQFQATLTAASPYTTFPTLDDVKIDWPGQTALVEIGGNFTKRSNYGQFKVLVDGSELVKALELKITGTNVYRGQNYSYELNTEQDPMNTGR